LAIAVVVLLVLGAIGVSSALFPERQVGIVVKRFACRALWPGWLVALGGEAGERTDTLTSVHWTG
jgi:hypothetical protein